MSPSPPLPAWKAHSLTLLAAAGFLAVAAWGLGAAPVGEPKGAGSTPPASVEHPVVEVRCRDNSLVKLTLQTPTITLATRYGRLTIPTADIARVEFATRVPESVTRQVAAAIKALASKEFKQREQASAELLKIGAPAYAPLQGAAKSDDAEVQHAAEELLDSIKESVPEELLVTREHDIVHTRDSKITGTIETALLRATTLPFGEVQVKLADMRVLRSTTLVLPEEAEEQGIVVAPPQGPGGIRAFVGGQMRMAGGAVMAFANQPGKTITFTATGNANGAVWGTGVYTIDSDLGAAAVHAGALKLGQTGPVKVQIVPAPPAYTASVKNGIASAPWPGGQGTAFQILKGR